MIPTRPPVFALLAGYALFLALPACIPFDIRPRVLRDPAGFAVGPERYRDDEHDRWSIGVLTRVGADFPANYFLPTEDAAVVHEALRSSPPTGGRVHALECRDAVTMILRRRPQAAYVALVERMSLPTTEARAGAVWMFADLDGRRLGMIPEDHVPPWSGPERDAAIARMEVLLFSDPDPSVRTAASTAFERGIGGPARPTWGVVLAGVQREQDPEVHEDLLRLLATREAPAADRIDAAVRHTRDWYRAYDLLDGLVIQKNRRLLESAFRRGPYHFHQALLKRAGELEPPQPWLEGIVLLGTGSENADVRASGDHLSRSLGVPSAGAVNTPASEPARDAGDPPRHDARRR